MELPKKILQLFPMWEYRCPKCNIYVEPTITLCPHCSAPFNAVKWRVPPRFLKSRKAMSEYAHKVLAPKLSPKMRTLLFKQFTMLFSDGFENDFTPWTTQTSGGSGLAPAIDQTTVRTGSKSCKLATSSGTAESYSICRKILGSAYSSFNIRTYVYLKELPDTNNTKIDYIGIGKDGTGTFAIGGLYRGAAIYQWFIQCNSPFTVWLSGIVTPSVDTWICLELHVTVHATAGVLRLDVNGSTKINETDLDTDNYGNLDRADVRLEIIQAQSSAKTVYHDDVVIADTDIGCVTDIDIEDAGSGADVPALEGQIAPAETGEGADALALEGQINVDDMGGLESEEVGFGDGQEMFFGDWGCSMELVKIEKETDVFWLYLEDFGAFKIRMGDVGSGVDNWPYIGGVIEDFGYGVEEVTVTVSKTVSDSGVGVDEVEFIGVPGEVITIEAAIPVAEVGEGLETKTDMTSHCTFGDAGDGVDVPTAYEYEYPTIQDVGIGAEVINVDTQQMKNVEDAGVGTDILAEFERNFLEAGVGEEILKEFNRSFAESGVGSELVNTLARATFIPFTTTLFIRRRDLNLKTEKRNLKLSVKKCALRLRIRGERD